MAHEESPEDYERRLSSYLLTCPNKECFIAQIGVRCKWVGAAGIPGGYRKFIESRPQVFEFLKAKGSARLIAAEAPRTLTPDEVYEAQLVKYLQACPHQSCLASKIGINNKWPISTGTGKGVPGGLTQFIRKRPQLFETFLPAEGKESIRLVPGAASAAAGSSAAASPAAGSPGPARAAIAFEKKGQTGASAAAREKGPLGTLEAAVAGAAALARSEFVPPAPRNSALPQPNRKVQTLQQFRHEQQQQLQQQQQHQQQQQQQNQKQQQQQQKNQKQQQQQQQKQQQQQQQQQQQNQKQQQQRPAGPPVDPELAALMGMLMGEGAPNEPSDLGSDDGVVNGTGGYATAHANGGGGAGNAGSAGSSRYYTRTVGDGPSEGANGSGGVDPRIPQLTAALERATLCGGCPGKRRPRDVALGPCGHVVCQSCASAAAAALLVCPVCNHAIGSVLQLHL